MMKIEFQGLVLSHDQHLLGVSAERGHYCEAIIIRWKGVVVCGFS